MERILAKGEIVLAGGTVVSGSSIVQQEASNVAARIIENNFTWFSYRTGLEGMMNGGTTDMGWGCMHRTGQMLLMRVLQSLGKGKGCLEYFMDRREAKYSVHQIAEVGEKYGKPFGTWLGPSTLAFIVRDLFTEAKVEVVLDQIIDDQAILSHFENSSPTPVLVLIPFMLGLDRINPENESFLHNCLAAPFSTGLCGGTPNHALYLIGHSHSTSSILCLDPHTTQPAFTSISSLGCIASNSLESVSSLDTSCLLTFLVKTKDEANDLIERLVTTRLGNSKWPLFAKGKPAAGFDSDLDMDVEDWD
eukprot:TRINITY_DN9118_c2_g1_i1.p1 TRINITY_DN9118_c2_g1~~TRINITY_DN9118_c2_g1_i1.p1  ORF type:complete len:331 (+),score=36.52 TRINITY_DN9118_c2_g1_i1:80-994(+)